MYECLFLLSGYAVQFNFFGCKVHRIFLCMSARLFLFFPPVCCVVFGMVCKLAGYEYGGVEVYMCVGVYV